MCGKNVNVQTTEGIGQKESTTMKKGYFALLPELIGCVLFVFKIVIVFPYCQNDGM